LKIARRTKLKTDNREFRRATDRAIRKELVRGVIELILNSDDSYRRLGVASGKIEINVKKRKGGGATVSVRDDAQGMDGNALTSAIEWYGRAASGIYEGHSVRGYFGHGLKDAILGLGQGKIITIKDNVFRIATLSFDEHGTPSIVYFEPVPATLRLRTKYGIAGNGTLVEIQTLATVQIHQMETLREQLTRHFMLRRVMSNEQRSIVLRYSNVVAGSVEARLDYKEPKVDEILLDEGLGVDGDPLATIVIKRAAVPLESPNESPLADGGLLIGSTTAVFDHSLFRFDGADGADYLFGEVLLPTLDDLLRKDEPILSSTRDGLLWSHETIKPFKLAIENKLARVVEEERRRKAEHERDTRSSELGERVASAVNELNKIAAEELASLPGAGKAPAPGHNGDHQLLVPESGFGFIYEFNNLMIEKKASLLLRARDVVLEPGAAVSFALSDDADFELYNSQAVLEPRDDHADILEARVYIEGRRAGAECVITASAGDRKSEALCRVVTKKAPPPPPSGGLIRDVKFDDRSDPRSRVRFDKETGDVLVYTRSPSVALYIGPSGEGAEEDQGAVLTAELVLEAVCREIARRGVESGTFIAPEGGETEAMQREFGRLQNKYGALIHHCFAGPRVSSRRGRLTAQEEAEKAAMPV